MGGSCTAARAHAHTLDLARDGAPPPAHPHACTLHTLHTTLPPPLCSGTALADPAHDHCITVDAGGLPPGARLRYRFRVGALLSPTGHTKTAAEGPVRVGGVGGWAVRGAAA